MTTTPEQQPATDEAYKPGAVANGHLLTEDGEWVRHYQPGDVANGHVLTSEGTWVPVSSGHDAAALAAYREQQVQYIESITGWKPLTLWYSFWAAGWFALFVYGIFADAVGAGLISLIPAALCALYARYLYRGGRVRVWFFIF